MGGPYEWMSYQRLGEYVRHLSNGLAGLGLGEGARAGVYGPNCPEWMIAMQATNRMGMQCVPLYDTLGANAVEFILNHSDGTIHYGSRSGTQCTFNFECLSVPSVHFCCA